MEDVQRFSVELEFVQCLANPNYVNHLAQHGFLNRDDFVNYLKYLQYWRRPEYARFLKYPQCLHFLDLLQHEEYRKAMAVQKNARFVEDQQILQWHHYIRKRLRLHDMITNQTAENNNQSSG